MSAELRAQSKNKIYKNKIIQKTEKIINIALSKKIPQANPSIQKNNPMIGVNSSSFSHIKSIAYFISSFEIIDEISVLFLPLLKRHTFFLLKYLKNNSTTIFK